MKIKKLIWVFEQLIPVYQKAVDEKWNFDRLCKEDLDIGICWASYKRLKEGIYIHIERYYEKYTKGGYLFKEPLRNNYKKPIRQRLDFMKSEIPQLKKLIKKGYTHI